MKKHSSHPSSNDKMNPSEPVGYDSDVDFEEDIDSKSDSSDENATAIAADGLIPLKLRTSESVASTPYRAIHFSDTETNQNPSLYLYTLDGIQSIADDPDFVVPYSRWLNTVKSPRIRPNYWIKAVFYYPAYDYCHYGPSILL